MENKQDNPPPATPAMEKILSMLLLRLWLGLRSLVTGMEKFAGNRSSEEAVVIDGRPNEYGLTETATDKVYGISHYHGIPEPLLEKLKEEPLIPNFLLVMFDIALGPLLILAGLMLLLGVATRITLFAMGLIYTVLTAGLIFLAQDAGVAWLAVHIALIVLALNHTRYNRFEWFHKQ